MAAMTPTSRHQFFTTARQFAAALLLLAACVTPLAHAQEMVWTVAKLLLDGKETSELTGVGRRDRSADPLARITLKQNDKLPPGAEIAVPPRASVELLDANGNRTMLYPGSRIVLLHLSARGARQQMMEGRARFSISKALDYFNVNTPDRFLATVKGTDYELTLVPGKSVEFKVAEGAVEVERTGTVRIAQDTQGQPREVENVAEAESLKAGQAKRYDLTQAQYLREFGNFKEAEAYFRQALAEAEKGADQQRIQRARESLGWMLITLSVYQEAASLFQRNLEAARQNTDEAAQADALQGLGVAYAELNEYRRAIAYYEQALAMRKRLFGERDRDGIAVLYNNLGVAYLNLNEYRRAIEHYEQSLKMQRRLFPGRDMDVIALSLRNLGDANEKLGDVAAAAKYREEANAMSARIREREKR